MRLSRFLSTGFVTLTALFLLTLTNYGQASGATESVAHSFVGYPGDGNQSRSGLTKDASGNLYGTTLYGGRNQYHYSLGDGAVFKLAPNGSESIIWDFGSGVDGWQPYAGLIVDTAGNLYGTTRQGGTNNSGTVFELSPAGGAWIETFLYSFGSLSGDGTFPTARLTMDTNGHLYGTTPNSGNIGLGTVFELSPIGPGAWSETVLYSFRSGSGDGTGPFGGLITDTAGNLYGTTQGGGTSNAGTAFELSPPSIAGNPWIERLLWTFGSGTDGALPYPSLIMDGNGNLYGTTGLGGAYDDHKAFNRDPGGTAFKLSPPSVAGNPWTEKILWSFGNTKGKVSDGRMPEGSLLLDGANLIGTTEGGGVTSHGTAFKLAPSSGSWTTWTETILWSFPAAPTAPLPPAT